MRVQLLSFPGCPNAPVTRELLQRVLEATGHRGPIEEVNLSAPETPESLASYGSPTIFIDGIEVEGADDGRGGGCRLYWDARGRLTGVPSEAALLEALTRAERRAL